MTKKKPENRVRVWHPGYKAEAHPLRRDLAKWVEKGWIVQPADPETEAKGGQS